MISNCPGKQISLLCLWTTYLLWLNLQKSFRSLTPTDLERIRCLHGFVYQTLPASVLPSQNQYNFAFSLHLPALLCEVAGDLSGGFVLKTAGARSRLGLSSQGNYCPVSEYRAFTHRSLLKHIVKSRRLQLGVVCGQINNPNTLVFYSVGRFPAMNVNVKAFLGERTAGRRDYIRRFEWPREDLAAPCF